MSFVKSFYRENRKLFFSVFLVWICASLAGTVYSSKIDGENFLTLSESIRSSFNPPPLLGKMIFSGFVSEIKLLLCVLVASLSPILSPLIFVPDAFLGFSSGISCGLIMRLYSFKGALLNLTVHILPLSLSLPLYFMLFVSGLKFSLAPRKSILTERVSERRKQWGSYILLQGAVSLCLFLITVAESFLCKGIINFFN